MPSNAAAYRKIDIKKAEESTLNCNKRTTKDMLKRHRASLKSTFNVTVNNMRIFRHKHTTKINACFVTLLLFLYSIVAHSFYKSIYQYQQYTCSIYLIGVSTINSWFSTISKRCQNSFRYSLESKMVSLDENYASCHSNFVEICIK